MNLKKFEIWMFVLDSILFYVFRLYISTLFINKEFEFLWSSSINGKSPNLKSCLWTSINSCVRPLYPAKLSFPPLIFIFIVVVVWVCVHGITFWCGQSFYSHRVETIIRPLYCFYVVYLFLILVQNQRGAATFQLAVFATSFPT